MTAKGPGVSFEGEENFLGLDSTDSSTDFEYTKNNRTGYFYRVNFTCELHLVFKSTARI